VLFNLKTITWLLTSSPCMGCALHACNQLALVVQVQPHAHVKAAMMARACVWMFAAFASVANAVEIRIGFQGPYDK
jgi:hypothetical protein